MKHYLYRQFSGRFETSDRELLAIGYSGKGEGKNNPSAQDQIKVGPIPCGMYTIEGPFDSPKKGPLVFHLIPDASNNMFNRDDFEIHGDSIEKPGQASEGCIILNRATRIYVKDNLNEINRLQVI